MDWGSDIHNYRLGDDQSLGSMDDFDVDDAKMTAERATANNSSSTAAVAAVSTSKINNNNILNDDDNDDHHSHNHNNGARNGQPLVSFGSCTNDEEDGNLPQEIP